MAEFIKNQYNFRDNIILSYLAIAVVFIFDLLTPLGYAVWILFLLPLHIAPYKTMNKLHIYLFVTIISILIWVGFYLDAPGIPYKIAFFNRALMTFFYWVVAYGQVKKSQAYMKLAYSEENLKTAQSLAHLGSYEYDFTTGKVHWTKEVFNIYEHDSNKGEPTYDELVKYCHPEDLESVMEKINKAAKDNNRPFEIEFRIITAAKKIKTLYYTGISVLDKSGKAIRRIGTVMDITKRKEAEDALQKMANDLKKYAAIFEHAKWGVVIGNGDGIRIELANPEFARMHGYTIEELMGKKVEDMFAPEERAGLKVHLQRVIDEGNHSFESKHIRKDGSIFPVEIQSTSVKDESGNHIFRAANVIDITERKNAEETLRRESSKFQAILDNAPVCISMKDISSRMIMANRAVYESFDVPPENKFLGSSIYDHFPKEIADELWENDLQALKSNHPIIAEEKIMNRDGQQHYYLTAKFPVYYTGTNELIGIGAISTDITEQKALEEKLKETLSELRRNQLRFERAETLAHVGSWVMNVQTGELELSDEMKKILGLNPDRKSINISEYMRFVHPDDVERMSATTSKHHSEGIPLDIEYRIVRPDGDIRYIHGISGSEYNETSRNSIRYGAAKDVTENKNIERALENERELFESIFSSIPVMITIYDPALQSFRFNDALNKFLGWTLGDAAEGNFVEKVYPDPEYRKEVIAYMQSLEPGFREFTLTAKDGSHIESSWSNILLKNGTQIGIGIDLREIKQAERTLRENQEKLLEAQRLAHIGSYSLNYENDSIEFSEELYRIFGWNPEKKDITYEDVIKSIHPDDYFSLTEAIKKSIEEKIPIELDYRIITPDDQVKFLHTRRVPVFNEQGKLIGVFGTSMDITNRKQQELKLEEAYNKLQESEARLLDAQRLARIGNYTIDFKNNATMEWSDEMYNIWEIDKNKPFPSVEELWKLVHPDDWDKLNRVLTMKSPESERVETEFRIVFPGNRIKYVHIITRVTFDESGNLLKRQGVEIDITERKEAQIKLEKTLRELERSNKELEQFAYVTSHDLQEPLRMVSNYLKLLERKYKEQLDEKAKEYIYYAVDGSKRMSNLIKDLLVYSRVTSHTNEFESIDLNKVFGDVTNDLKVLIKEKRAKITSSKLPSLNADSTQMHQLLQNLIGNAIKFHGDKTPEVSLRAKEINNGWLFSVKDNGIGIDSSYYDRIFQVFQRLHEPGRYPGTGIGLAVCKKIVERHGGRIWVESEVGKGTTFYFTLQKDNNLTNTEERDNLEMLSA